MDRTREIQNFENQGTSMHGPSPAGALAGLRRRHLCRQSPSRAIQRRPRTPTPLSGKLLCQSNLRLPSPKAWALLVLLELGQGSGQREDIWGPVEAEWWGARNRKGRWGDGGSRATGAQRELAVPPSERHRPARGGPQGRSAGESGRAKPRGCREEARVAGTRDTVIKASSLHPRHPLGLLRPSEAEAPRCRSRGWSAPLSEPGRHPQKAAAHPLRSPP